MYPLVLSEQVTLKCSTLSHVVSSYLLNYAYGNMHYICFLRILQFSRTDFACKSDILAMLSGIGIVYCANIIKLKP